MRKIIGILTLILLAACQTTVSQSPPSSPSELETTASLNHLFQSVTRMIDTVYVQDETVYLNVGPILVILDVSNRQSPRPLGAVKLPVKGIAKIFVSNGYAYVAAYDAGLRVVNVSNPGHPIEVSAYVPPVEHGGGSRTVIIDHAAGQVYAYVAAQEAGLRVVDVSDPTKPIEIGAFYTELGVFDVAIANKELYLVISKDRDQFVQIIDISDPTRPKEVNIPLLNLDYLGVVNDIDIPSDLAASPYIYAAAGSCFEWGNDRNCGGMLRVIDVTNPIGAQIFLPYDVVKKIVVSQQHAYLAVSGKLRLVDISDPSHPQDVTVRPDIAANDIAVADDTLYATIVQCTGQCSPGASRDGGLQIFDLSNPAMPELMSFWQPTDEPSQDITNEPIQEEPTVAEPAVEPTPGQKSP